MPDRRMATLLALASRGRWTELQQALARPENREVLDEAREEFEERGGRSLEAREWETAIRYFEAVFACVIIAPSTAPLDSLKVKWAEASRQLEEAPPPPPGPKREPKPPPPEPEIDVGDLFERLADLALRKQTAKWHRLLHDRQYRDKDVYLRMAAHFEAAGDERREKREWREALALYDVAIVALIQVDYKDPHIREKFVAVDKALLANRLAQPRVAGHAPERLDWDHGLERVEELVLAGRIAEADGLLARLGRRSDDYGDRCIEWAGRCEWLGDQLEADHPEAAVWFYEIAVEWFRDWVQSSTSGGEGAARSRMEQTAPQKLAWLKARLSADSH
jgi:hypothetical protein